jgi:hypothetical protein
MKKLFNFCILLVLISYSSKAQWINQLSISPIVPTTQDVIFVHCNASFPSTGCELLNDNVSISGNIIEVNANHEQGNLMVICTNTNSVSLGYLPAGNYTLNYHTHIHTPPSPPSSATGTLNFTVETITNIESDISKNNIEIFPNPSNASFQFHGNLKEKDYPISLTILNLLGQEVYSIQHIDNMNDVITHNLPRGTYFVQVLSASEELFTTKLIVK